MVEVNISKEKKPKNPHSATCQHLMDWWKMMLAWCYHHSCKLVALELHNSCFYIVVIKLHMYAISHTMRCIYCNSYNFSDSTHVHRNTLSCNELQMVIATQKPSCKTSWKSPQFFIMILEKANY